MNIFVEEALKDYTVWSGDPNRTNVLLQPVHDRPYSAQRGDGS